MFPLILVLTQNGHVLVSLLLVSVPLVTDCCNVNLNQYVQSVTGISSRVPSGEGTPDCLCPVQCTLFCLHFLANNSQCSLNLRLVCTAILVTKSAYTHTQVTGY